MYLLTELYADEDREAAIRSWKSPSSSSEQRNGTAGKSYKESSSEGDEDNGSASSSSSGSGSSSEDESSSSVEEDDLATADDEELGEGGAAMGLPEKRVLAKYILTRKDTWYKEKKDWSDFQTMVWICHPLLEIRA